MFSTRDYDKADDGMRSGLTSEDFWNRRNFMSWNKAEEREMEMLRGPPAVTPRDYTRHLMYLDEPSYAAILLKSEEVARTHAEIGRQMLHKSTHLDEFEDIWRKTPVDERIRVVIEGLRHATTITGGWEACVRVSTPDLTVASMAKDPNGYIKILRHMIQSYLSYPKQDGYTEWIDPTGTFERFYGIQRTTKGQVPLHRAIRNMQAAISGDRQCFVARFVFGVLYDLGYVQNKQYRIPSIDLPRLPLYRNLTRGVNPSGARLHADNIDMLNIDGSRSQADVDREIAIMKQLDEGKEEMCAGCYRVRDEIVELVKSGAKMQHCSKCLKVNRRIPYCSASCQALDWNRHKKEVYCGKILSKVLSPPHFPPASPVPPPTLAYQFQFNTLPPRSEDIVYVLRKNKGKKQRQFLEIELEKDSAERAKLAELREQLREGMNINKMEKLTQVLLRLVREQGTKEELPELEQALLKQLAREFEGSDVKALASCCGVTLDVNAEAEKEVTSDKKENVDSNPTSSSTSAKKKKNKKKNKSKKKKKKSGTSTFSPAFPADSEEESEFEDDKMRALFESIGLGDQYDNYDSEDESQCTCGLPHNEEPGGLHEWKSWLPKHEGAGIEDIIKSMAAFSEESARRMRC